ncbi:MAG: carbohydrate ABC transporter permease [Kiritimatiellae bacterium]|nr:carbohydrate ABC transporter permease [Kiritimatiellia bacterium]
MSVILPVEHKTAKARFFLALVYAMLILGGVTMVWPFLVMLSASLSGPYDYYRHAPVVRAFWNRGDRFLRYVASCYPRFPGDVYPDAPAHWSSWIIVSRDAANIEAFTRSHLAPLEDPATAEKWNRTADDFAAFNRHYDIRNSVCAFDPRDVAGFTRSHYEAELQKADPEKFRRLSPAKRQQAALDLLNETWLIRYPSFFSIRMLAQQRLPLHHATWDYPTDDPKTDLYQDFKQMYRERDPGPMTRTVPYESRALWQAYLRRPDVLRDLGLDPEKPVTPAALATALGLPCPAFENLPFPLPPTAAPKALAQWDRFIRTAYPRRLLRIRVSPELERAYQAYVARICKTPAAYTKLTGKRIASFTALTLEPYENSTLWRNFIPEIPDIRNHLEIHSAEQDWQAFLLSKYGSLDALNAAYGWDLPCIEAARFPLRETLSVTFARHGWRDFLADAFANYRTVSEFLFLRGRAFANTLLLVLLSVLASLTVNPLAAYALSRFGMAATEKILIFLLATIAFPAAVTAIPGFLLIRDLGMLNTFAALVLPTLANGMSIFILKGFFDALPRELYEAAAIDGAKEWQIFLKITLPMTTPILAVSALNAFIHAYNSWEWALLVCQRQSHWTLAVWMYQMSQQWSGQPWAVMAGFVLVSIPTAIVFIACQKVILRGIVLPNLK